jgi:hypothetical protein
MLGNAMNGNRFVITGLALSIAGFLTGVLPAQPGRPDTALRNGWMQGYREARALAQKTGKPMMLVFRCVP